MKVLMYCMIMFQGEPVQVEADALRKVFDNVQKEVYIVKYSDSGLDHKINHNQCMFKPLNNLKLIRYGEINE